MHENLPAGGIETRHVRILGPPNPKRTSSVLEEPESGPHFPANFSLDFALWAVNAFSNEEDLIVDPFGGSGTTGVAAAIANRRAQLLELNAPWVVYSKCRTRAGESSRRSELFSPDFLSRANITCLLESALLSDKCPTTKLFASAAILAAIRDRASPSYGMNHSWPFLKKSHGLSPSRERILKHFEYLLAHGRWLRKISGKREQVTVEWGNAARLGSLDKNWSCLISSPPYLSRLDYVRASWPENLYLNQIGLVDDPPELRREQTGGVLIRHEGCSDKLPIQIENVLESIRLHPSKGSATYYEPIARTYFCDLRNVFTNLFLGGTDDRTAILVLQDSWYKNIYIRTSELVAALMREMGMELERSWEFQRVWNLSAMNPSVKEWRSDSKLNENVMLFRGG